MGNLTKTRGAALLGLALAVAPAGAATIHVNTTADEMLVDGNCSLREAVAAANGDASFDACEAGSGADTIEVPAGLYTIALAGAQEDLLLDAVVLDGCTAVRTTPSGAMPRGGGLFNAGTLHLQSSRISGSLADSASFMDAGAGGGLYNLSTGVATLVDSTISGNGAGRNDFTNGRGGGIYNAGGTVNLERCTVAGNRAGGQSPGSSYGGGIYNASGSMAVVNSTVSGNLSEGGISFAGGIQTAGSAAVMTLVNCTVAWNATPDMNQSDNLALSGGGLTLRNTIVAGGPESCSGLSAANSLGHNLESPGNLCGFASTGDQVNVPAAALALEALALNAPGTTATHALGAGSVAIGAADSPACPATDQRGVVRDAACDIGAFEWPPSIALLADGFESGNLLEWSGSLR
jgi:CSLREA domain-containing protein